MNIFELPRKDTEELPPHTSVFIEREAEDSLCSSVSLQHHPSVLSFPVPHSKKWYLGRTGHTRGAPECADGLDAKQCSFYPTWDSRRSKLPPLSPFWNSSRESNTLLMAGSEFSIT